MLCFLKKNRYQSLVIKTGILEVSSNSVNLAVVQSLVFLLYGNFQQSFPRLAHFTPHMALLPTCPTAPTGFFMDCQALTLKSYRDKNTASW